mmetsp:Transcript_6741/g.19890  ORF Transcript_6741/g.19890 Transcript_6741/m.19890 type:complete len:142 (-) Transcript_6741:19-444(-)
MTYGATSDHEARPLYEQEPKKTRAAALALALTLAVLGLAALVSGGATKMMVHQHETQLAGGCPNDRPVFTQTCTPPGNPCNFICHSRRLTTLPELSSIPCPRDRPVMISFCRTSLHQNPCDALCGHDPFEENDSDTVVVQG